MVRSRHLHPYKGVEVSSIGDAALGGRLSGRREWDMATRKKKSTKGPHCKRVDNGKGGKRKMCFDGKGKITSAAKVAAHNKRAKTRRKAA